ncbi:FAD-dependent oxidoreductase [Companilactobacillus formosensis]|uniref:FAD-dependent oxidoreductase n=1 Tax=Companilactobacillus formosensis TaxID=1617889 RepID=UPI000E64E5C9|nr:FAD-dependent oxidoreductase [Companilactobacillus formosensis]
MRRKRVVLNILWLIILFLIPMPLIVILNTQLVASVRDLSVYDFGIVAYIWWLVITYLSTRPSWLDRLIGLPSMYLVHGLLGTIALIAATIHKFLSFSFDKNVKNTGNIAWYLALFGFFYAVFFMSGWLINYFKIADTLKKKFNHIFKHQVSIWVHRLNLVVIALIFFHVQLIVRIRSITEFMVIFDTYTAVILGLYFFNKIRLLTMNNGTVISNESLNSDTQELVIQIKSQKKYHPGDFYFVSFKGLKKLGIESHPFSVTSAPTNSPRSVTFTIQNVGDFTNEISKVPTGTKVKLEGPFGLFDKSIRLENVETPIILYGLGTGIAPLLSIAAEYAGKRPIHVLWTVQSQDKLYYSDKFRNFESKYPNFKYYEQIHRIKKQQLKNLLSESEILKGQFYIVGPATAIIEIEDNLNSIGVSRNRLNDERLTL